MPHAGEDHGHAMFVSGSDHFFITHGTAGFDDGRDTRFGSLINAITERKINERDDWEFAYTAGGSYLLNSRTRLGLEIKETLGDTDEFGIHRKDHKFQIVPGIYYSPNDHIRILFGPAIGLTSAANDLELKTIFEIEF